MGPEDSGSVLGHYSVLGTNLQPLLSESTPLFAACTQGDLEAVVACVEANPEACTRLYNVLLWSSNSSDGPEQQRGSKSSVSIVQRSLLAIAASATSRSGTAAVIQFLLQKGANPSQVFPDGVSPVSVSGPMCRNADSQGFVGLAQGAGRCVTGLSMCVMFQLQLAQSSGGEHTSEVMNMLQTADAVQRAVMANASHHSHSVDGHSSPQQGLGQPRSSVTRSSSGTRLDVPQSLFTPTPDPNTYASSEDARDTNPPAFSLSVDLQHHLSLHQDVDVDHMLTEGSMPYSTSELVQPEYSTDDFRMFAFKVLRCSKRFAHDWRACPFAHPTENARRRDPREYRYCAIACPDYKQGFCVRGDLCAYAHGVFEAWLHPSRYRTQLCKDGANCHRPICFFAHSLSELRTPTYTWTPGSGDTSPSARAAAASMSAGSELGGSQATSQSGVLRSSSSGLAHCQAPSASCPPPSRVTAAGSSRPSSGSGPGSSSNYASNSGSNHSSNSGTCGLGAPNACAQQQQGKGLGGKQDTGLMAAGASGAVPPVAPGQAAAAMFGFSAPRMSNAFARRHGLNPKDNAMLNLQKIALQAPPGSVLSDQLTRMFHQGGGHAAGSLPAPGPMQQPAPDMYGGRGNGLGMGVGVGMTPPHHMGPGSGAQLRGSKVYPGQGPLMGPNPLMMPGFPYSAPNGLMAMQAMAAAAAHDPSALASLNHHLASLSLHPTAAAAYGQGGVGMAGFGGGMGFGHMDGAMASS